MGEEENELTGWLTQRRIAQRIGESFQAQSLPRARRFLARGTPPQSKRFSAPSEPSIAAGNEEPALSLCWSFADWKLKNRDKKLSVAVVGAGIAGLACARRLADYGIQVTVIEAKQSIGGKLSCFKESMLANTCMKDFSWALKRYFASLELLPKVKASSRIHCLRGNLPEAWSGDLDFVDALHEMSLLQQALVSGIDVRLGCCVASVQLLAQKVRIDLVPGLQSYAEFDAVVIAVPVPVVSRSFIRFQPPLPDSLRESLDYVFSHAVEKGVLKFLSNVIPKEIGDLAGFSDSELSFKTSDDHKQIIFEIFGSLAAKHEPMHLKDQASHLLQRLGRYFENVGSYDSVEMSDWKNDIFFQGSCHIPRDNKVLCKLREHASNGLVLFCGDSFAPRLSECGTWVGALKSGVDTAESLVRSFSTASLSNSVVRLANTLIPCFVCKGGGLSPDQPVNCEEFLVIEFEVGWRYCHKICISQSPVYLHLASLATSGQKLSLKGIVRTLVCSAAGCTSSGSPQIKCHWGICQNTFHIHCAVASGWDFSDPLQGFRFLCPQHRLVYV